MLPLFDGYKTIAVRDDRSGKCVISYHPERKEYLLVVDGKPAGPFTERELKALDANIQDVIHLRGRYLYIEDYTADGQRIETE